jgi:hypothetical protein
MFPFGWLTLAYRCRGLDRGESLSSSNAVHVSAFFRPQKDSLSILWVSWIPQLLLPPPPWSTSTCSVNLADCTCQQNSRESWQASPKPMSRQLKQKNIIQTSVRITISEIGTGTMKHTTELTCLRVSSEEGKESSRWPPWTIGRLRPTDRGGDSFFPTRPESRTPVDIMSCEYGKVSTDRLRLQLFSVWRIGGTLQPNAK